MDYLLVVWWLLVVQAIALASWPLAAALFERFPVRGAGLALPVGFVVIWQVGYWVGHVSFGPLTALIAVGALVAASIFVQRRLDIRPDYREYVDTVLVFTIAFLVLVWIRALDPAVHPIGGEKFLDFGLVKSLLRADTLPPEDMWFAGEPVAYYYGGHLLAALLTYLTGTLPAKAYNLALATGYATLVTAAYGLTGALGHVRGVDRRLAGAIGAVLVGVASNLATPLHALSWVLSDGLVAGVYPGDAGDLAADPSGFSYWDASRIIEGTINEFPFFAFLNGDLHAHMLSTPFMLLVAGLLFAYTQTAPDRRRRRLALLFGAVPPVAGLLVVVNTWSFPTAIGLSALAVIFGPGDPITLLGRPGDDGPWTEPRRVALGLGVAVLVGLLSLVWIFPFLLDSASTRSVALLPDRSGLSEALLVHGAFLLVFAAYLVDRSRNWRLGLVAIGGVAVLAVGLDRLATLGLVAVALALVLDGWYRLRSADGFTPDGVGFETLLLVAGAGVVCIVELAYVKEQAGPGRMNTVFKTYMQVWVLWAVAAGAMLVTLLPRPSMSVPAPQTDRLERGARVTAVAVLLLSLSLYAGFALSDHTANAPEPSLDATAFVEQRHAGEAAAIDWLDAQPGRPVIVTAAPGGYRWNPGDGKGASAPSSLTGIPTVAGWYHERGYRGTDVFGQRVDDVEVIYSGGADQQAQLLAQYDVAYIYVGPAEQARYEITVTNRPWLSVAHRSGSVTIYRVDQSAL
jgi:YYY domain-containing protein